MKIKEKENNYTGRKIEMYLYTDELEKFEIGECIRKKFNGLVYDGEIVSTKGRKISETRRFFSKKGDNINGKPLIVIINNGSASASEIVSGALKDHKRAIILGERTYGKGSVQSIIPLKNGGGIRLTISKYY